MLGTPPPPEVPTAQVAVPDDGFDTHVANAQRLAQAMKFEQALPQWRAAAKLRPQDQQVLSALVQDRIAVARQRRLSPRRAPHLPAARP